jgi:hypothetical protein
VEKLVQHQRKIIGGMIAMIAVLVLVTLTLPPKQNPSPVNVNVTSVAISETSQEPLTPADRILYRAIFAAQDKNDFATADQFMGELNSQLLLPLGCVRTCGLGGQFFGSPGRT